MNREPKQVRRRVRALTDPQPEFVSLVPAGANMTPFTAIKSDDPEVALRADTHTIVRLDFDKEKFPDHDTVVKWLTDGGYSGYSVEETESGFVVQGDADVSEAKKIELGGVVAYVAKTETKGSEAEAKPTVISSAKPVTKTSVATVATKTEEKPKVLEAQTAEIRAKFDSWVASYGTMDTSLGEVISDAQYDMLPPGFFDVTAAMYGALRNNVALSNIEGIRALMAEYGEAIIGLMALFPIEKMESEDAERLAAKLCPDLAVSETPPSPVETSEMTVKTEEQPVPTPQDQAAAETAEKTETQATETETVADPAVAEQPAEAAKTETPVAEIPAALTEALTALVGKFDSFATSVKESMTVIAERVDTLETERQSRKGADDVDAAGSAAAPQTSNASNRDFQVMAFRNTLGLR